jgi:uncharacterized membrane protein
MKKLLITATLISVLTLIAAPAAFSFWGEKFKELDPEGEILQIPINDIDDGVAHYFKTRADDGTMVSFFTLKSSDGVIRAAIDACDVCFRAGKGYIQEGEFMICENCGQRFPASRINVVKGGCNPAPLERHIQGKRLVISMEDINKNSWYCKHKTL